MPENTPAPAAAASSNNNTLIIAGSILVGALIIGGSIFLGLSRGGGATSPTGQAPTKAVNVKDIKISGDPFIGQANAPVILVYWSDYQCPYCKAFEVGGVQGIQGPAVMPEIIKKYVDTGKVKVVFKDFPFLGKDSTAGALYERAVWDLYPAQYYAWRAAMFTEQDEEGDQGFGDEASIDQLIKQKFPKMDLAKIKQALDTNKVKYDAEIAADRKEGAAVGVSGTPGFVTGTTLIPGFYPIDAFTAAIDAQLK